MVHTQFDIYIEERNKTIKNHSKNPIFGGGQAVYEQILLHNTICSVTSCYRANSVQPLFSDFEKGVFAYEDSPMWLEIIQQEKIGYLSDSTTVYRIKNESISRSRSVVDKRKYIRNINRIHNYYIDKFPITESAKDKIIQKDAILQCCLAFVGEEKDVFNDNYIRINQIPRRLILMKFILQFKFVTVLTRSLKHLIYKQY